MADESTQKKNVKGVKKKVSPYPFEGEMLHDGVKVSLSIQMVSPRGMIAQVTAGMCHVGTHYQCQFFLPQSRIPVHVEGKVFKTFDRSTDLKNIKSIERMTEVIFINMSDADRAKVATFMKTIGQKE